MKHISDAEKLNMSEHSLESIQKLYKSYIRSMINFMQSNQDIVKTDKKVVIQLGTSRMEGTGMIADNGKHQLNLQSQVSGHYEPSH